MDTAYAQKEYTGRTEGASISLARSAGLGADRSPGRVKRAADRRPLGTSPSPGPGGPAQRDRGRQRQQYDSAVTFRARSHPISCMAKSAPVQELRGAVTRNHENRLKCRHEHWAVTSPKPQPKSLALRGIVLERGHENAINRPAEQLASGEWQIDRMA
jgi:hypothetical protein